ncbi:MAG: hypothetical protein IBX50_10745 [Marinospirillum sp.]|uniref:hypothetical protein n=1 Tax=Marinospirillum sp. TaxID=2183934 RepID=UPI0019E10BE8|nr:hypothetical protein [Marinospirillum sp.]MBE0507181.1 hypothetical protein [Marinospirillum sp.]
MKKILLLCLLLLAALPVLAAQKTAPVVTTAPVVQLIAESLLDLTPLQSHYLPPTRLPINRIPAWLSRVDVHQLPRAEAVLTFESTWPELAIFPLLRQLNIRLVAVDLAHEVAPGGARVIQRQGLSEPDYFWMDFSNLTLMSNIAARDLARLWPEHAEQIDRNRQQLIRRIQQTALQVDELLFAAEISTLAVTDEKLMPLVLSTALPLAEPAQADLVLSTRAEEGLRSWVVDPLLRPGTTNLSDWLESQVSSLQSALK